MINKPPTITPDQNINSFATVPVDNCELSGRKAPIQSFVMFKSQNTDTIEPKIPLPETTVSGTIPTWTPNEILPDKAGLHFIGNNDAVLDRIVQPSGTGNPNIGANIPPTPTSSPIPRVVPESEYANAPQLPGWVFIGTHGDGIIIQKTDQKFPSPFPSMSPPPQDSVPEKSTVTRQLVGSQKLVISGNLITVPFLNTKTNGILPGDILQLNDPNHSNAIRLFKIVSINQSDSTQITVETLNPDNLGNLSTGTYNDIEISGIETALSNIIARSQISINRSQADGNISVAVSSKAILRANPTGDPIIQIPQPLVSPPQPGDVAPTILLDTSKSSSIKKIEIDPITGTTLEMNVMSIVKNNTMTITMTTNVYDSNEQLIASSDTQPDPVTPTKTTKIPLVVPNINTTRATGTQTVSFEQKTIANGLGSNYVSSIWIDQDQTVWATSYHPEDFNQGGISVSRNFGDHWETFRVDGIYDYVARNRNPKKTGLLTNNFREVKRDRISHKLVFASDEGVYTSLVKETNHYPMIVTDDRGKTSQDIEGIQKLNDNIDFNQFSTFNGLGNNKIRTVYIEETPVMSLSSATPLIPGLDRHVPGFDVKHDEPTMRSTWWAGTQSGLSRSQDQGATWKTFDLSYKPVDSKGPSLIITSPFNNQIINTGPPSNSPPFIDIVVEARDENGVKSVEASFDNQTFFPLQFEPNPPRYTKRQYDIGRFPSGRVFLYVRSTDIFGNESQAVPILLRIFNPPIIITTAVDILEPHLNSTISDVFPCIIRIRSNKAITNVMATTAQGATGDPVFENTYKPAFLAVAPHTFANETGVPDTRRLESLYEFLIDTSSINATRNVRLTVKVIDETGSQFVNGTLTTAGQPVTQTFFNIYRRLPHTPVVAISGRTIWAGTDARCGLSLSEDNGKNWRTITIREDLLQPTILAIALRKNEVWVAWSTSDDKHGLSMSSDMGKTWREFTETGDNLPDQHVLSIAFQGKNVWVGTRNGAGKLEAVGTPFTIYRVEDGLSDNQINNIYVDCDQIGVWLSTRNGISLTRNAGKSWFVAGIQQGLANDVILPPDGSMINLSIGNVKAIIRYRGNIYAATDNGLGVSSNEGHNFDKILAPIIGSNSVNCFKISGENLWIGTDNGLTKLDSSNNFITYRTDGIYSSLDILLSKTNTGLKHNRINFLAE